MGLEYLYTQSVIPQMTRHYGEDDPLQYLHRSSSFFNDAVFSVRRERAHRGSDLQARRHGRGCASHARRLRAAVDSPRR